MKLELGLASALIGAILLTAAPIESSAQFTMPTRNYEQIPFINGGIGSDEADFMRSVAKNYSLRFNFAGRQREFVADVAVVITDSSGQTIFKAGNAGPLLYLNPHPGKYKVAATFNGVTQTREVTIAATGGTDLNLVWNAPSGDPEPADSGSGGLSSPK